LTSLQIAGLPGDATSTDDDPADHLYGNAAAVIRASHSAQPPRIIEEPLYINAEAFVPHSGVPLQAVPAQEVLYAELELQDPRRPQPRGE
jgi:hypothetical protein